MERRETQAALSALVSQMVQQILTQTDFKAIAKNRGFSARELSSRALFEHVFLSSAGLPTVMETLSPDEIALLHVLYVTDREVDIHFFERLYGADPAQRYGTYTQRYKPVFDAVQHGLVRKGLLIITQAYSYTSNQSKMELWRFRFPVPFGAHLPSVIPQRLRSDQPGTAQADPFRAELSRRIHRSRGVSAESDDKKTGSVVKLVQGSLQLEGVPFSAALINAWRDKRWESALVSTTTPGPGLRTYQIPSYPLPAYQNRQRTLLPLIYYALAGLGADEWISPDALTLLLDMGYGSVDHPSAAAILHLGWEAGCLARLEMTNGEHYRLVDARYHPTSLPPERYLQAEKSAVYVDIDSIPYQALEALNQLVQLSVDKGRLKVTPSSLKLVNWLDTDKAQQAPLLSELVEYLQAHDPQFDARLERIRAQWGKYILHENLLVAKIADLSLRVKLQKAFESADQTQPAWLLVLAGDYVAFPRAMLGEVERIVKKTGHVIKTVQAPK